MSETVIIGVGGCGVALVKGLSGLPGAVTRVAVDSDARSFEDGCTGASMVTLCNGSGSGGDPEVVTASLETMTGRIQDALGGAGVGLIVAGMGGATGTYAAPLLAETLRDRDLLTVVTAVAPFRFEGRLRTRRCSEAIERCRGAADALWVIANDDLADTDEKTAFGRYFEECNRQIRERVEALARLICCREDMLGFDESALTGSLRRAGVLSVGVARCAPESPESALREAATAACMPFGGIEATPRIFVHVAGGEAFPLRGVRAVGDAARVLAPQGEVQLAVSPSGEASDGATVAVVALAEAPQAAASEGEADAAPLDEVPSIFAGRSPAMYDGQNLDIPTFRRREMFEG